MKEEKLKIRLLYEGEHVLAHAMFSLLEFRSKHVIKINMNSLLCGFNNNSCYLKFNIGMTRTKKPVCASEIKFKLYKKIIYLPPENYYACEILP